MENIIKKAIEGGWIPKELLMWSTQQEATEIKTYYRKEEDRFGIKYILGGNVCSAEVKSSAIDKNVAILDPLFWQALQKSCGWDISRSECCNSEVTRYPKDTKQPSGTIMPTWYDWCKECKEKCRVLKNNNWEYRYDQFFTQNRQDGFDQAISWLENIIK